MRTREVLEECNDNYLPSLGRRGIKWIAAMQLPGTGVFSHSFPAVRTVLFMHDRQYVGRHAHNLRRLHCYPLRCFASREVKALARAYDLSVLYRGLCERGSWLFCIDPTIVPGYTRCTDQWRNAVMIARNNGTKYSIRDTEWEIYDIDTRFTFDRRDKSMDYEWTSYCLHKGAWLLFRQKFLLD